MVRFVLLFYIIFLLVPKSYSQVFTNKEVGKKNAELIDSLKTSEYPYSLPIWGDKATKAGYKLPLSAGVSAQYFWQESDLIIDNLQVGFNGGTMYDLDGLVRFDKAIARTNSVSVRPDVWVLPFLNVYAILGYSSASTDVGFGVWVPDSSGTDQQILSAGALVEFNAPSFGLGFTPTIGVGGGFLALDMNIAWTDVPQLDKPAFSFVFGPRLGKNFNLKKTDRTLAVWAGGFRFHINSGTSGSINLEDIMDTDELSMKVDNAIVQVEDKQQQVDAWWAGLTPIQQQNPVNKAKYNAANSTLDRAGEILSSADNALNDGESATIQYSMDKRPKDMWNFLIGTQFQLNKHFMLRAEVGFLSSRTQVMTGIQYRFGL